MEHIFCHKWFEETIFCTAVVKLKYLSQHLYMNKKNVAPEHTWSIDYVVKGLITQFFV
mgnify:CR=1 FL=1